MALSPIDEVHALQIQAGTLGRKAGHDFEDQIALRVNELRYPYTIKSSQSRNLFTGHPAELLMNYLGNYYNVEQVLSASAISTGALATSEDGRKWLSINGADVRRCKSDLVITITLPGRNAFSCGISTKQCNNPTPTNAQLYFTTARGFSRLLRDNGLSVSDAAIDGLRQFCGDVGYRPLDNPAALRGRVTDPRRYFWEEIPEIARAEWEATLSQKQNAITTLLLQKAYIDDPFIPEFLIHKTRFSASWELTEVAIYSIAQIVDLSSRYQGFATKPYSVRKGSYKDPTGVRHLAPRFGIVQMQRGGQEQHPEQLQFNLEAGYFYKLEELP